MGKNVINEKSFAFALRIVKLYKYLSSNKKEFVIAKQLYRSGTAIGALVEEGTGAQSRADFVSKLSMAHKECRETLYWIRLLKAADILTEQQADSLLIDCEELRKILASIIKTTREKP